jgi:hypothetical protein
MVRTWRAMEVCVCDEHYRACLHLVCRCMDGLCYAVDVLQGMQCVCTVYARCVGSDVCCFAKYSW